MLKKMIALGLAATLCLSNNAGTIKAEEIKVPGGDTQNTAIDLTSEKGKYEFLTEGKVFEYQYVSIPEYPKNENGDFVSSIYSIYNDINSHYTNLNSVLSTIPYQNAQQSNALSYRMDLYSCMGSSGGRVKDGLYNINEQLEDITKENKISTTYLQQLQYAYDYIDRNLCYFTPYKDKYCQGTIATKEQITESLSEWKTYLSNKVSEARKPEFNGTAEEAFGFTDDLTLLSNVETAETESIKSLESAKNQIGNLIKDYAFLSSLINGTNTPGQEVPAQTPASASTGAVAVDNAIVITYNTVSGSAIAPTTGTTENPPKVTNYVPARSGYTFQGWIDENGNKVLSGTVIEKSTTLTAVWEDNNIAWDVRIASATSPKIKLSVQTKNTSTTYTVLGKVLVLKLEGERKTSEGSTPAMFQYQIVNKGNEYVATDWKNTNDGTIRVASNKKCRIYIRAIADKYSKIYRTNGFIIDTKAPKIAGIRNGKTYKKSISIRVSDKVSGIKKILINGKKTKNGMILSKNGKYKLFVMDQAGNKKTIRFAIWK